MKEALNNLLQTSNIWRASAMDHTAAPGISSGFPELDQLLPGHGWPKNAAVELLHDQPGIGEIRLIMPALAQLSRNNSRWIAWIAPPYIPYPPALISAGIDLSRILMVKPGNAKDAMWATEKALASGSCSAVLAWPGSKTQDKDIRRLQVAAKEGHCWNILFRPTRVARHPSPVELRILLQPLHASALSDSSMVNISILKRRGGWATDVFPLDLRDDLNRMTPCFSELIVPFSSNRKDAGDRPRFPRQNGGIRDQSPNAFLNN
jgi:protein ImuA